MFVSIDQIRRGVAFREGIAGLYRDGVYRVMQRSVSSLPSKGKKGLFWSEATDMAGRGQ